MVSCKNLIEIKGFIRRIYLSNIKKIVSEKKPLSKRNILKILILILGFVVFLINTIGFDFVSFAL